MIELLVDEHDKKVAESLGTVSHGTMRPKDLIPAFMSELEQLWHSRACALQKEYEYTYPLAAGFYDSDDSYWLLDSLFDALDECAPDGCYFGAHIGDGADYGFWKHEDGF